MFDGHGAVRMYSEPLFIFGATWVPCVCPEGDAIEDANPRIMGTKNGLDAGFVIENGLDVCSGSLSFPYWGLSKTFLLSVF
jgi:hypothetical protein